jgi:hypothetical protein
MIGAVWVPPDDWVLTSPPHAASTSAAPKIMTDLNAEKRPESDGASM